MRTFLRAVAVLLLFAGSAFAQGVRYDNILLGVNGGPRAGVTVAVCQPTGLATTAASVAGNVATLTMSSNPVSLGFVVGGNISVMGFTGGDTYFNSSFVLTAVSSTTLTFNLTHSNASATSNGSVTQTVSAGATCAPWATIYTDDTLTIQMSQPFRVDGLGNYGFGAAPGKYTISFNGAGVNPITNTLTLPCVPNSTCPGLGGVGTVTSFSAGNLSPLFTSSVATPTTTPALSFSLNSQSANLLFASPNGSSGVPSFRSIVGADFGSQSANTFLAGPNGSAGNPLFRTIAGADVPATTSNCSGVQFAQGLNAGHTPVCATPPTFVASGASHAVGYVPDPGSSAGTTHFLREDATWSTLPSGVSESTLTSTNATGANLGAGVAATIYEKWIWANAHTITRFTLYVQSQASGCTTNLVAAVFDENSSSNVTTLTTANLTTFFDSGALSVATTAGHTFDIRISTASSGCVTTLGIPVFSVSFQ